MNDTAVANVIGYAVGVGVAIASLIGVGYARGKRDRPKRQGGPHGKHW